LSLSQNLVGAWHPVAASVSGRELDVAEMQVAHLQFDDQRYVIFDRRGEPVNQGPYQLYLGTRPWLLDLLGEPKSSAKSIAAICELESDQTGIDVLKICYALEGGERPSSFEQAQAFSGPEQIAHLYLTLTFRRLVRS
jgi:uncharacterized protein (TIGR03067 family)